MIEVPILLLTKKKFLSNSGCQEFTDSFNQLRNEGIWISFLHDKGLISSGGLS
jgi:hypothetical protein